MEKIVQFLKSNGISLVLGLVFYFAFYYLAYSGNRLFDSDTDGSYNPRQAYLHGAINHYYHK